MGRKPPIFRSIRIAFKDAGSAFGAMPAETAIVFAAFLAQQIFLQTIMPHPANASFGWSLSLQLSSAMLLGGLVTAPFAVLIHRRIILSEHGGIGSLPSLRREIVAFYVATVTLCLSFQIITILPSNGEQGSMLWVNVLLFLGFFVGITYVVTRLTMLFPAIAIGNSTDLIKTALRNSRGLFWRIFWIGILSASAVMIVFGVLGYAAGMVLPFAGEIQTLLKAAESTVMLAVAVAFASRLYLWRVAEHGPEGDDPQLDGGRLQES